MAGFTFLHAADLHIDSPLVGLDRYEGAPVAAIRGASRRAFENLVQLALEERVAFVVLAGDVFDGNWRDFNTGVFLNLELARLERHGIRVYLVHGNHDAEGQMTRELRLPTNSHVFSTKTPETVRFEEHRVALHGQSFAEQKTTKNLASDYPARDPAAFNIGVLHTALEGREGHQPYAPCSLKDLASKGYDYWALGHVHRREEVSRRPWVVFPGNLQGRHARETGAKGCSLVTVVDGAVSSVRHVSLDVVRWVSIDHDVTGLNSAEAIVDRLAEVVKLEVSAAEGRIVAARVRAHGLADAPALAAEPHRWRAELVSKVASVAGPGVWLEKVSFEVERPRALAPETAENLALLEKILLDIAAAPPGPLPELVQLLQAKVGIEAPDGDDSPFSAPAIARARAEAVEIVRWRLHRARTRAGDGGA